MQFKINNIDKIEQSNAAYQEMTLELMAAYAAFQAKCTQKTMAELLEPIVGTITDGASVNGYPQITLGAELPGPIFYVDGSDVYAAINALADLPKYRILDVFSQEAYYNPVLHADNIKVMFDCASGLFHFWNWKGAYTDSVFNHEIKHSNGWTSGPDPRYDNLVGWRLNMVRKHRAIDAMLQCKGKLPFAIVMFDERQVTHYQGMVKDFMNKPYSEYRVARSAADSQAHTARTLRTGGSNFQSSKIVSEKRQAILLEIASHPLPFTVVTKEVFSTRPTPTLITNEAELKAALHGVELAPDDMEISVA